MLYIYSSGYTVIDWSNNTNVISKEALCVISWNWKTTEIVGCYYAYDLVAFSNLDFQRCCLIMKFIFISLMFHKVCCNVFISIFDMPWVLIKEVFVVYTLLGTKVLWKTTFLRPRSEWFWLFHFFILLAPSAGQSTYLSVTK